MVNCSKEIISNQVYIMNLNIKKRKKETPNDPERKPGWRDEMKPRHTTIQEVNEELFKSALSSRGGRETQLRALDIIPPKELNQIKLEKEIKIPKNSHRMNYDMNFDPEEENKYFAKINLTILTNRIISEFQRERLVKFYQQS